MFWSRKKDKENKRIVGANWTDAEWPAYIPKYHLHDFVAIDFEAANSEVTSACSMGLVIVRKEKIVDSFYSLMQPVPNHYDFWTTKVHGIRYKDTVNAERFPEVWKKVARKVVGMPMVAHGSLFDERVLKGLHMFYHMRYPGFQFYCTHRGSEKLVPDLENYKLNTVAKHFGYDLEHHHHALADAEACAVIAMNIF